MQRLTFLTGKRRTGNTAQAIIEALRYTRENKAILWLARSRPMMEFTKERVESFLRLPDNIESLFIVDYWSLDKNPDNQINKVKEHHAIGLVVYDNCTPGMIEAFDPLGLAERHPEIDFLCVYSLHV